MRGILGKIENRLRGPQLVQASHHPDKIRRYAELGPSHVADGARLFATRHSMVDHFAPAFHGGIIAEVGVMFGDFSPFLIDTCKPETFVAIDIFEAHHAPYIWDRPSNEVFQGQTHREFYQGRMARYGDIVRLEEGDSANCLARFPDETFDMIYVDAAHDYESVKRDTMQAIRKLKANGILIFNDYIRYSHYDNQYYGVIPVVNDVVSSQGFQIVGFALQADMYCDIAIQRRAPLT